MKKIFCQRLREARGNRSQAAVAKLLGIAQQNYQRYEKGVVEPSLAMIHSICVTLGCSADWLLGIGDSGHGPEPAAPDLSGSACAACAEKDKVIASQASAIRDISAAAARFASGIKDGFALKPGDAKRRHGRMVGVDASKVGVMHVERGMVL